MVHKDDPDMPMLNQFEREREVQLPQVFGDIEGYESPIDGTWVEGRRARRYDLEKNNCIPLEDIPRKKPKNERFIKKHGLERFAD